MDLAQLDLTAAANAGAWVDILHPVTHEPVGLSIKVLGKDSDKFRELEEKHQREAIEAAKQRKRPADPITAVREQGETLLVACTVDWRWEELTLDGEKPECTPANVQKVYRRFSWVRDQVDVGIGSRANFLPR